MKKNWKPADWQKDPNNIKTERVQYWKNGIMLGGQMPRAVAREMVKQGHAYVMTDQAIGALED